MPWLLPVNRSINSFKLIWSAIWSSSSCRLIYACICFCFSLLYPQNILLPRNADLCTCASNLHERYGNRRQDIHKAKDDSYAWTYTSVKNILTDESYAGVLTNHRRLMREGKIYVVPEAEQLRHEEVYPVIFQREEWNRVQELLSQPVRNHSASGNKAEHRYAGLLTCAERGNPFVPIIRYWNGSRRAEYVCKGYHRDKGGGRKVGLNAIRKGMKDVFRRAAKPLN